jgi:hypothetical protein
MCSPATCRTCAKATYTGCGQHVEQVLKGVPEAERCVCSVDVPKPTRPSGRSLLARLIGR